MKQLWFGLRAAFALIAASLAIVPAASAAIVVDFRLTGASPWPGAVNGRIVFNSAGTNVAASAIYILSTTDAALPADPTLNLVSASMVDRNAFTVDSLGHVTAAVFTSQRITGGDSLYLYLNSPIFGGINTYELDRNSSSIVGSIASRNGLAGLTFTPAAAPAATPEPATWIAMVVGFGILGGALRRRRSIRPLAAC